MPRKTYSRRLPLRQRRRRGRRPRRHPIRMRRGLGLGKVFNFKRTVDLTDLSLNLNTSFSPFGYTFTLDNLPNVSEFTNLFNEIRLMGVAMTFYPAFDISGLSTTTAAASFMTLPEIYTVFDPCDGSAPNSIAVLNQYGNLKRRYFKRPVKRFIKPTRLQPISISSDETATTVTKVPISRKIWMRAAIANSITVQHFGLRGAVVNSNVTTISKPYNVRVTATYYFQCRQLR